MSRKLLPTAFGVVALLGVLHQVGSKFYLYWSLTWFDNVMHLLGGLAVGLFFVWIFYVSGIFGQRVFQGKWVWINSVIFVVAISILWEIFEHTFGITSIKEPGYVVDTANDFLDASLGALAAGLLSNKFFHE